MLAIHASALLAFLPAAAPSAAVLWTTAAAFAVRTFAVSAGYHRYFSHRAFRTSRAVQFAFAFVGGMAVMRGALWWASQHRQHHRRADRDGDPHAPWRGFLWSHMTWFTTVANQPTRLRLVRDFARFPELRWLDRHEWAPVAVFVAGSWAAFGLPGFVWIANVGSVVLCHATFLLNSATHRFGRRRYATADHSTNLLPVALLTFGEGWHNNHHRWPGRARLGEGWREIDVSWWAIAAMERLGLVWGVRR
jgi:stearoyl-CoA desaturase (delta-9 desaturase)